MGYKDIIAGAVLLLGIGHTGLKAQTMLLYQTSGEQSQYTVGDIRKMTFSDTSINIAKATGLSDSFSLSDLRFICFTYDDTGIDVFGQGDRARIVRLYPNPASNYIYVLADKVSYTSGIFEIFTPEGRVLVHQQIKGKQAVFIDISTLSTGVYLCRLRAGATINTAKLMKL